MLLWTSTPAAAQQPSDESTGIRVVVALAPPQTKAGEDDQADMVAEAQSDVLASPAAGDFELIHRFEVVPGMVGMASQESLDAMSKDPRVLAIAPDMPVYAALGESTTLINANRVWTDLGFTGAGVNVAVLDSGVDLSHPDLADSIVAQHCFNHGTCPPNKTEEGDSAMDENGHGTHVAGIITSDGIVSPLGVAPDAGIVAVRVLNDAGSGWTSDVVAGIDWVVAHQAEYNIRVMNLSLGGGAYPDVCDGGDANTMLLSLIHI